MVEVSGTLLACCTKYSRTIKKAERGVVAVQGNGHGLVGNRQQEGSLIQWRNILETSDLGRCLLSR
jgi:ATP-dependent Zn protease